MPAGSSQQVAAVELERVEPKVPLLFERDDTFYSTIEKRPVEIISDRDMKGPLEIRPGGKPGHFNPEGGDLGRGDMPTYDKFTINTVNLRFAMEWTAKREWDTDDRRKAVIDTTRRDLASAMNSFRRFVDSLCVSSAGNGVIGTIASHATNAGVDTYTLTSDGFGARLLQYGWDLQVWDAGLANKRLPSGATAASDPTETVITTCDYANKQISVTPSMTAVANTDVLVASGAAGTPPVSIFGIPYHHNNSSVGTWLGFDRSATPEIRANGVSANGALTLPAPRLALNKIGDRLGIKRRSKLTAWMHPCQQQAYEELGFEISVINKEAHEEGLDLYFNDNMRIAGAPLKKHYSWDKTRIDFVDTDIWGRAEYHKPGFFKDRNGNRFFQIRGVSGGAATSTVAYLVSSFNLFINCPPGVSYIDTLTVPSGY